MDTEKTNSKSILLVEDDPRDVELTLAALEEVHLSTRVAVMRDGAEVLDYLYCRGKFSSRPALNPIVLLLDNKMPKVSGLEVVKIVKADQALKMIPIVVLSSSREPMDLLQFYQHGANACVVKPVDFAEFTRVVKALSVFWTAINEPPPHAENQETVIQGGEHLSSKRDLSNQEKPAPEFALRG